MDIQNRVQEAWVQILWMFRKHRHMIVGSWTDPGSCTYGCIFFGLRCMYVFCKRLRWICKTRARKEVCHSGTQCYQPFWIVTWPQERGITSSIGVFPVFQTPCEDQRWNPQTSPKKALKGFEKSPRQVWLKDFRRLRFVDCPWGITPVSKKSL